MSLERYTKATIASNLAWRDYAEMPIDWLTAAGLVNDRLASALARFMATSTPDRAIGGDYWGVIEALEATYRRRMNKEDRDGIKAAVWWFLAPACGVCSGRGHPVHEDAPLKKEEVCIGCHGTGKAPHANQSTAYADALMRLDGAAAMCFQAIARKVA